MSSPMEVDPKSGDSPQDLHKPYESATRFNSDVLNAIKERKSAENSRAFRFDNVLVGEDFVNLLHILLKLSYPGRAMDQKAFQDHLDKSETLYPALSSAYTTGEFATVMTNSEMLSLDDVLKHDLASISGISPSNSHQSFQSVFNQRYRGHTARLFVETLNKARRKYFKQIGVQTPYNWSISVVQSSGMGKSRMVEEAGNIVFTIPINLREEMKEGNLAYPPEDKNMRQFFMKRQGLPDEEQQAEYAILLMELFAKTGDVVRRKFPGMKGKELAGAWADYLKVGQKDKSVGENRQRFYDEVIQAAEKEKNRTQDIMEGPLQRSCKQLLDLIRPGPLTNKNECIVYFDEAHTLTQTNEGAGDIPHQELPRVSGVSKDFQGSLKNSIGGPNLQGAPGISTRLPKVPVAKRTPFHNLGTVLSKLVDFRIFFVFLSTDSRLEGLAPPPTGYPSVRVTQGSKLIPPFTELPFDVYEKKAMKTLDSLTLQNAGEMDTMIKFGRPLWYAHRKACPDVDIFAFATIKLSRSGEEGYHPSSALAAVGVRVGITFDETTAYSVQSNLVESHLRVVYSIPQHRTYMHTGSPSEPVVAEAAGRYFDSAGQCGIAIEGPKWLSYALEKGFLARGERGELAGRLLLTSAHDIAMKRRHSEHSHMPNKPIYHRPIPVLDFLDALFHEQHREKIRTAKCVTGRKDVKTLGEAFSGSYVFFSHFALAEDSEMLSTFGLATALVRGMALQAKDGQESIDAVIPIHTDSLTTVISPETTSAINIQFKNRKVARDCHIDRSITVPEVEKPVISIIFEFGVKGKKANTVEVMDKKPRVTRNNQSKLHQDDHHYEIIARGCSSTLFGAIPPETESQYEVLLRAWTIMEDFPRRDDTKNVVALKALKPAFSGDRQKERHKAWTRTNETGSRTAKSASRPSDSKPSDAGSSDSESSEWVSSEGEPFVSELFGGESDQAL